MRYECIHEILKTIYCFIVKHIPFLKPIYETMETSAPITLKTLFMQKILGFNRFAYWPMHYTSTGGVRNILIGVGSAPGISPGCYIQGIGEVFIGDYTIIAPNVGIISANHDIYDYRKHVKSKVVIGNYCWLGMNSVILPNVTLGDHTIVAAGAVVNRSFPEGYCILAGNPAKIVKKLEPSRCVKYTNKYEYCGYIRKEDFEKFRKEYLRI